MKDLTKLLVWIAAVYTSLFLIGTIYYVYGFSVILFLIIALLLVAFGFILTGRAIPIAFFVKKKSSPDMLKNETELAFAELSIRLPYQIATQLGEVDEESQYQMFTKAFDFLRRSRRYARLVLGAALITSNPNKVLLVRLKSGEFKDHWGLPAGYAGPEDNFNPLKKVNDEIRKYLGSEFSDYLKPVGKQGVLSIRYSNPSYLEAHVIRFSLQKVDTGLFENGDIRLIPYDELEKLEPLNPFVYDVMKEYESVKFSRIFQKKMDQIKQRRAAEIVLLSGG